MGYISSLNSQMLGSDLKYSETGVKDSAVALLRVFLLVLRFALCHLFRGWQSWIKCSLAILLMPFDEALVLIVHVGLLQTLEGGRFCILCNEDFMHGILSI